MIRVVIVAIIGIYWTMAAAAQNRCIEFQDMKWEKLVKRGVKEKKLIFVDCYTSWCGPCKMLAKEIFTRDSVADFFNRSFVNTKIDMEKGEGCMLRDKFGVKVFPTLLFIDPATEKVVHRMVGAGKVEWLIAGAKNAMDTLNCLLGLTKRYEEGEREISFIESYLQALSDAHLKKEQAEVVGAYVQSLTDEALVSKANWALVVENVTDPLSLPLKRVMKKRVAFCQVVGEEQVNKQLTLIVQGAVMKLAAWRPGMPPALFDENINREMIAWLQTIDLMVAPSCLAYLYTASYVRKNDYKGMLNSMNTALKFNLFRGNDGYLYVKDFLGTLVNCEDTLLVNQGIRCVQQWIDGTDDWFVKSDLLKLKAALLTRNGDKKGAEIAILAAIKKDKGQNALSLIGQTPPDFQYRDRNGQKVSLSSLKGKYVYIDIWATWCFPCCREIPHMAALEKQFQGKDIHFVSISCDKDIETWKKKLTAERMTGIQLNAELDSEFMRFFAVRGIPRFILLDQEGKVVHSDMSRPSQEATVKTLMQLNNRCK